MFSKDAAFLILVKKNRLELFTDKASKELIYPQNLVQNLEILDIVNFEKSLSQFFKSSLANKNKVLIVLSEELLFSKTFPLITDVQIDQMVSDFVESVPFSPNKVSYKKISRQSELILISTNKDFYVAVKKALEDTGVEIMAVVPISSFKDNLGFEDDSIDTSMAKKILGDKNLIKASDFLSDEEGQIKQSVMHKSFSSIYLIILGVLLIGSVAILGAVAFDLIPNPLSLLEKDKKEEVKKVIPEKTPPIKEASPSSKEASQSAKLKEELTIQILNGSGIAGQAGSLKEQLEALGFKNIETGNTEKEDQTETTAFFSDQVSSEDRQEIVDELESTFEKVTEQEGPEDLEFDVRVETGSYAQE